MPNKPHHLYWTKDAFSLKYSIFKDGKLVGNVADKTTRRSVKAALFGERYIFENEGFLNPHTNIIHINSKTEIGRIDFEFIRPRATINVSGKTYSWKFTNFLNTRWVLADHKDQPIVSGKKRKEGIFHNQPDVKPILLLCALITRNRYMKQGY
jgi:hypothetical protein